MPYLRGHHLVCLHFYHGAGYDERFIKNLNETLERALQEGVTITAKADDICRSCPWLKEGRCSHNGSAENVIREMDTKALELLDLSVGITKGWDNIRDRIPGIFREWYNLYCMECDWNRSCEQDDFYARLEARL